MISPWMANLIHHLPKGLVLYLSRKVTDSYIKKYANIKVTGIEELKNYKKPILFVCNHLSNSDGLVLNKVLSELDVTFVAGVKLSNNPITNIGMNVVKTIKIKPNSADKDALTKVIKASKEGNNLLIFPEGTRSRTGAMIEAKKGILLIARLTKATIIPIGIWGSEKLMPVNKDGNMSSENFNYSDVVVNIGKPVELAGKEADEDRNSYEERALRSLMKEIANLLPEEYRGVYA